MQCTVLYCTYLCAGSGTYILLLGKSVLGGKKIIQMAVVVSDFQEFYLPTSFLDYYREKYTGHID